MLQRWEIEAGLHTKYRQGETAINHGGRKREKEDVGVNAKKRNPRKPKKTSNPKTRPFRFPMVQGLKNSCGCSYFRGSIPGDLLGWGQTAGTYKNVPSERATQLRPCTAQQLAQAALLG